MSPKQYVRSLGGQVFLVLLIGVALSACLALGLANIRRLADLDRIHIDRVAERVMDYVILLDRAPAHVREEIRLKGFPGLHPPRGTEVTTGVDSALSTETSERLGRPVRAFNANPPSCLPYAPSRLFHTNTKCWMVYTTLKDGSTLKLATFSPRPDTFAMSPPDAVFLSILGVGVIVLTFFVSRMVSAPLQQLSTAARVLAEDLDSPPVTEQGPTEVRQAIRAFNTMQERLRDNVEEKTRILASITHDLQTPMTRLRLRLEKVTDSALRSRLIDDLRSMQRLVRQGLEYHRGSEVEEPMVVLRLDSLLESVIDDASEGGADVKFIERANCDVEARPEALRRCFSNLIDNALKYGGQAEVYVRQEDDRVHVHIRDRGPGIPDDKIEAVFQPFCRLDENVSGGVGLGLTIARNMAQLNNGDLQISNGAGGGLDVVVTLKRSTPSDLGIVTSSMPVHKEPAAQPSRQAGRPKTSAAYRGPKLSVVVNAIQRP